MRTERQRDKIINFLKRKGKASSLEMMQILNITSPHRRMFEINQMQDTLGFCIKSIKTKGKDGTKFNLYYLSALPKIKALPKISVKELQKHLIGLRKEFYKNCNQWVRQCLK